MSFVDPRSFTAPTPPPGTSELELMRQARSAQQVSLTPPPAGAALAPPARPAPLAPPQEAFKDAEPDATDKMLVPPVVNIRMKWTDVNGKAQEHYLPVRILSFDERVQVSRRAALEAKGHWNILPTSDQEWLYAIAQCLVSWPTMPAPVRWAIFNDDRVAFQLSGAVERHRQAYFRGDSGEGAVATEEPEVAFVSGPFARPTP